MKVGDLVRLSTLYRDPRQGRTHRRTFQYGLILEEHALLTQCFDVLWSTGEVSKAASHDLLALAPYRGDK
jgi:hypothetical protein